MCKWMKNPPQLDRPSWISCIEIVRSRAAGNCSLVVQGAESHTCHEFPWIAPFLADNPEQFTIYILAIDWYLQCGISPGEMPSIARRPKCHLFSWYHSLWTIAAEEVGRWTFADWPNCAHANQCCDIYWCMSVDWLHQLLKGLFRDHTWEWIGGFLNDIYGQKMGMNQIDERFSIIPAHSDLLQFGDTLTHVNQWTSAGYRHMVKNWLAALVVLWPLWWAWLFLGDYGYNNVILKSGQSLERCRENKTPFNALSQ